MIRLYVGDVRARLKGLPSESVHCAVTSPPYWGLRSYGVEGQLGLEATFEEYVQNMVDVFREVWRVLRKDGVLWLNLGDCYHSGNRGGYHADHERGYKGGEMQLANQGSLAVGLQPNRIPQKGLKDKDLVGIPWRVALVLQADGWYLRMDCIWHKPNPMPESVTDRPTKSHEYMFLLTKSARYFYDAEAVREEATYGRKDWQANAYGRLREADPNDARLNTRGSHSGPNDDPSAGRNMRSVWTIPTFAFPGSHFATFPPALVEPCIKAGTSQAGCCPKCGKPWTRVVEKRGERQDRWSKANALSAEVGGTHRERTTTNVMETVGWQAGCKCDAGDPRPCVVLDPFCGSGTTLMVADRLGRDGIGIELSPDYAELARLRITQDSPMFAQVEVIR